MAQEVTKADMDSCGLAQDAAAVSARASEVSAFLKALSHDGRLLLLCHLASGPKSVTELETLLSSRQAAVSQQLARLRYEGMVVARREGQTIFYSILDDRVATAITMLAQLFGERDDN